MRVTEQTHRRLTLRHTPYVLWLLGAGFAAVGIMLGAMLFGSTTLRCDRATTQCELTHSNVFGDRQRSFAADGLDAAEVERRRDSDGDSTYRVVIHTQTGEIPLTQSSSSNWGKRQRQADAINAFIQNPAQPTLELNENNYLAGIVFFGAFTAAGSVMLLFIQSSTFTFDKTLGKLHLTRSHIFGRKRQESYPLRQLIGAQVQPSDETYRVVLMLESGKLLPLTNYYSSGLAGKQSIVTQICQFLDIRNLSQESTANEIANEIFSAREYRALLRLVLMGSVAEKREALQAAKTALETNPDDLGAYVKFGAAAIAQGRQDLAREKMEQARSRFLGQQNLAKVAQINQAMTQMGLEI